MVNEISGSGHAAMKDIDLEDADAEAINKRRQETLQFQTDKSEVSFVNYRAIIDDRE